MAEQKIMYSLVADIGGTNTRFQLISFHKEDSQPNVIKQTFYSTKEVQSFNECLKGFVEEFKGTDQYPQNATIAIAAAPFKNKVKMVNSHWPEIDGDALGKELNIHPFRLMNDFEAIGYSLLKLPKESLVQINEVQPLEGKRKAVIGPGTGLGECVLHPTSDKEGKFTYSVCPTEGGHKDFAVTEDIDIDYLRYSLKNVPEVKVFRHLSTERAFCGPSIPHMYNFFCEIAKKEPTEKDGKEILRKGLKKEDTICEEVLKFHAKLYGTEVSNFALDCLPYSGIFLVGAMTNAVYEFFVNDKTWMNGYLSKDETTNKVLARFPIYVITEKQPGLLGAFAKAQIDAFDL